MQWLTKTRRWMVATGSVVLMAVAIVGLVLTRESSAPATPTKPRWAPLVDEQPVQSARRMAALASGPEEQRFALQALRLADHAYLLETGNVVMSGPAEQIRNDESVRRSYLGY